MSKPRFRTHDLLRIRDAAAIGPAPDWAIASLAAAPWVVVRRAGAPAGQVAVGVRGLARDERFAAFMAQTAVVEVATPESLRGCGSGAGRRHPVLNALRTLAPPLDAIGLAWGPAGGAGFELASGAAVLRDASDLDLVARAAVDRDLEALDRFRRALESERIRVDVLVETARGAVGLAEMFGRTSELLMRTPTGPRLVTRRELGLPTSGEG